MVLRSLTLVALAACKFPALVERDAAVDAQGDAAMDALVTESVVGTSRLSYLPVAINGTNEQYETTPEDLTGHTIAAWLPTPTGYAEYAGSGTVDGTFSIPDVPESDRYLLLFQKPADIPWFWEMTTREPDMGYVIGGRPGGPTGDVSTKLMVQVTGTVSTPASGQAATQLDTYVYNLRMRQPVSVSAGSPWSFVASWNNSPLADAVEGEHLVGIAMGRIPTGGSPSNLYTATDVLSTGVFGTTLGQTSNTTATLTALATTPQTVVWDGPSHQPLIDRTGGQWFGAEYQIVSFPRALIEHGVFSVSSSSFRFSGVQFPVADSFTLGPFPRGLLDTVLTEKTNREWVSYSQTYVHLSRTYRVPGGTNRAFSSGLETWAPLTGATETIRPRVEPPQAPTLNGLAVSNDAEISLGTGNPVLAWTPPATGPTSVFRVALWELFLEDQTTGAEIRALFDVRSPQLAVPRSLLKEGHYYMFLIINVADGSFATRPRDPFVIAVRGEAPVFSGLLRFVP